MARDQKETRRLVIPCGQGEEECRFGKVAANPILSLDLFRNAGSVDFSVLLSRFSTSSCEGNIDIQYIALAI